MNYAVRTISTDDARLLLLQGARLLDDPNKPSGPAAVRKLVRALGYVQLDSINVIERAHHLTLFARNRSYLKSHLESLYKRAHVFEHWTHDASLLPIEWYSHWHHQRGRFTKRVEAKQWLKLRLGDDPQSIIATVLARIEREGPLLSSDFEHIEQHTGGWWNWKPAKAALEYLWWRGDLTIIARPNFHKVYDLTTRHITPEHRAEPVDREAFITWAVAGAIHRLGVATPKEIAAFFAVISLAEARTELEAMADRGEVDAMLVGGQPPVRSFAAPDWEQRLRRARTQLESLDDEPRLLSPFDPIARDRARLLRLFDFNYRFEAFTPEAKRVHGYYVLPILKRDRLIGRVDLKHDRKAGELRAMGLWWEGKADVAGLKRAMERLAQFIGATSISLR